MSELPRDLPNPPRRPFGAWCQAVLENTRDVVSLIDRDRRILYESPSVTEVLGYSPEELLGRDILDLIHPDDRPAAIEALETVMVDGDARITLEVRVQHRDGDWRFLAATGRSLLDEPAIDGFLITSRDVTDRRQAEERERELARVEAAREEAEAASRRIEAILDSITDGYYAVDADWRITYVNRRGAEMARRSPEELVGRTLWEAFPQTDPESEALLRQAMRDQVAVHFEVYYPPLDLWTEVYAHPSDGGLTIGGHEISERKRAEEALRKSEMRFRQLAENIGEVFWMFTPDFTRTIYVNPAYERVFGSPPEALYRNPLDFLDHVHPEDRERTREAMARLVVEETTVELRVVRPDGELRWIVARGTPIRGADGGVIWVAGLTQDVTEHWHAELELRRHHAILESIIEGTPDVVFLKDRTGRYRLINSAGSRQLGRPREDLVGATDPELFPPEEARRVRECDLAVMESGSAGTEEIRLPGPDGERIFDVLKVPFWNERGEVDGVIGVARDMTERKRMEEALRESEEHYRLLFDESPIPMWLFDPRDLSIVVVNEAAVRRYGFTREEFRELTLFDIRLAEDAESLLEERELLAGEEVVDFRSKRRRHRTKGGDLLFMDVTAHRFVYGGRSLWLASLIDVTEQVRAENELRESEERFRQLAENIRAVFWMFDAEFTRTIYVSPAYEEIWGRSREQLMRNARCCLESALPEDQERLQAAMERVREGPQAAQFRIRRPDGEERWMEWRGFPIRDEAGEVYRIAGLTEDITERKRAEDELRRQGEMVRMLQVAAVAANVAENLEDALTKVVEEMCRFVRFAVGHVRILEPEAGKREWPADIWCLRDPDRFAEFRAATEALSSVGGSLLAQVRATREPAWVADLSDTPSYPRAQAARRAGLHAGIAFPVMAGDEVVAVMEFFSEEPLRPDDLLLEAMNNVGAQLGRVVERRRAESLLRAAKEEAERANRAKSEFLSRMSHELRTPMNAILGFAQILELDLEREEDQESIQQILRAGRHLLGLIDEVLDLAKIEAERMTLSLEPVRIDELVRGTLELVRAAAAEQGVTIDVRGCDFTAQADQQRLKQVLLNLASNAVKYNRRGGSMTIWCEEVEHDRIRICVADTGRGLTPEQKARIFTPFDRLGVEDTGIPGTGLGLSLSKALVEAMGGVLEVESTAGAGSTFRVELPRADALDEFVDETHRPDPEPASSEPRRKVLYVEDNLSNLRLVERILSRRPEVVLIPAMQGRLGLDLAREHRPDLILLDVHLPDVDGHEVLTALKSDPAVRDVPVVVISADATPRQIERMREAGARDYLTKPIDVSKFLEAVDREIPRGDGAS